MTTERKPQPVSANEVSRAAPDYISRVTEMLTHEGEDGYAPLRIERREVYTSPTGEGTGISGTTVLVSAVHGEVADVALSGGGDVHRILPRGQVPYSVARVLIGAVDKENMDE